MSFRGRGRKVYHKTRESYQQNLFNRGRFTRSQEPIPRDDCFEDNVYEADNILLDNVDPLRPDLFPRFTPVNKTMYLSFSSESMLKMAIAAIAMKPEFDSYLNQKKAQQQLESQASLLKLTQSDISNSITPAITQITDTVKEVQQMVKAVVDLSKAVPHTQSLKKKSNSMSEGEEVDEPPRKRQKHRSYRKKVQESESSEEEANSPNEENFQKKAIIPNQI